MSYGHGFQQGSELQQVINDLKAHVRQAIKPLHQSLDKQLSYWESETEHLRQQNASATSTSTVAVPKEQANPEIRQPVSELQTMTPQEVYDKAQSMGNDFPAWVEQEMTKISSQENA